MQHSIASTTQRKLPYPRNHVPLSRLCLGASTPAPWGAERLANAAQLSLHDTKKTVMCRCIFSYMGLSMLNPHGSKYT